MHHWPRVIRGMIAVGLTFSGGVAAQAPVLPDERQP